MMTNFFKQVSFCIFLIYLFFVLTSSMQHEENDQSNFWTNFCNFCNKSCKSKKELVLYSPDDGRQLKLEILKIIGEYLQEPRDALNFGLANRRIYEMVLEPRKRDEIDPIRYFLRIINPQLLLLMDRNDVDVNKFHLQQRLRLFDDVHDIFLSPLSTDVINDETIKFILKEEAADLYDYINQKPKYDPKEHYGLYNKYVQKMQSNCHGHWGFATPIEQYYQPPRPGDEKLPIGTYYTEKDCGMVEYSKRKHQPYKAGFMQCVEQCRRTVECNACSIGNSFHDFYMILNPGKCSLRPRATYHYMSVWIKDQTSFTVNEKPTDQEFARANKYVAQKIDEYVKVKKAGYAPPTLVKAQEKKENLLKDQ